jgi:hypothetical protein
MTKIILNSDFTGMRAAFETYTRAKQTLVIGNDLEFGLSNTELFALAEFRQYTDKEVVQTVKEPYKQFVTSTLPLRLSLQSAWDTDTIVSFPVLDDFSAWILAKGVFRNTKTTDNQKVNLEFYNLSKVSAPYIDSLLNALASSDLKLNALSLKIVDDRFSLGLASLCQKSPYLTDLKLTYNSPTSFTFLEGLSSLTSLSLHATFYHQA